MMGIRQTKYKYHASIKANAACRPADSMENISIYVLDEDLEWKSNFFLLNHKTDANENNNTNWNSNQ